MFSLKVFLPISFIVPIIRSQTTKVCDEKGCELKQLDWIYVFIIIGIIIGSGAVVCGISVFGCVRYKKNKELATNAFHNGSCLKIEDIQPINTIDKFETKSTKTKSLMFKRTSSTQSGCFRECSLRQLKASSSSVKCSSSNPIFNSSDLGQFKAKRLFLNPNNTTQISATYISTYVTVKPFKAARNNENVIREIVQKLHNVCLENVAKIYGYVIQEQPIMYGLVIESGEHGSLYSLLSLGTLDLVLKLPLLADLCQGLEQIHKSSLEYHGKLTSLCCIVNSQFVLKIQLDEFPKLKSLEPLSVDEFSTLYRNEIEAEKLWSAPEIIRGEFVIDHRASDVYSFAIIMHEILYQKGPFYIPVKDLRARHRDSDGSMPKSPIDTALLIVKILKDKKRAQIRPSMKVNPGDETVMLVLKEMIKNCWSEIPSHRWHLNKVKDSIRKIMRDMHIANAYGNAVGRLELCTTHLQQALQQKVTNLEEERRRIRNILDRLFPGGIANMLIEGERSPPVQYNNICVYYNDLVDFTVISSKNSPATVVKFLNTLFLKYDSIIEMYAIHPVTRIGDAYMLVSGIPKEYGGAYHAREIAQAALQIVKVVKGTVFEDVVDHSHMQIRTGIGSGSAVAGVVGRDIPSFCICGEAVVIASTIESNSKPNQILVPQSTYELLDEEFEFKFAKTVEIAKVKRNCYWLYGMKDVKEIVINKRLDYNINR